MTKRVQLNEKEMENVVGGAFNFYTNSKGQKRCYIDNIGTFYCSADAFDWFVQRTAGSGAYDSPSDILAEGKAAGYFWE